MSESDLWIHTQRWEFYVRGKECSIECVIETDSFRSSDPEPYEWRVSPFDGWHGAGGLTGRCADIGSAKRAALQAARGEVRREKIFLERVHGERQAMRKILGKR